MTSTYLKRMIVLVITSLLYLVACSYKVSILLITCTWLKKWFCFRDGVLKVALVQACILVVCKHKVSTFHNSRNLHLFLKYDCIGKLNFVFSSV